MSFLTTAYLLERYGPRLDMHELAEVLKVAKGSLANRIYRNEIDLRTYMDGGKRYANAMDVAEYLDRMSGRATSPGAGSYSGATATTSDAH